MKYVYMLRAGKTHYKVGVATNVSNRIKSIQTGSPHKIEVVATNLVDKPDVIERALHKWLAEYKTDGGTEWFELTDSQALDLAIKLNNNKAVDLSEFIALKDLQYKQIELNKNFKQVLDYLALPEVKVVNLSSVEKTKASDDESIYENATRVVRAKGRASTSLLQRELQIGYGRAARLIDRLEREGTISKFDGARPRTVLDNTATV